MAHDPLRHLLRSIGRLGEKAGGTISDAQLLHRFVRSRDEAAFELLVWRHGPMVLGVCRRLLGDCADADDAFQTTFLVLVRKAASVSRGEVLGGWLYQVAYRAALRVRATRARRTAREQDGVDRLIAPPLPDADDSEVRRVLDDEINRLPARQRVAFILCCLEGKTGTEAAQLIGCAPGTVSSRLTRARERLRRRLLRRGVAPAAIATAIGLGGDVLAAPLPAILLETTVTGATQLATGGATLLPAQTISHVEGVLRAMFVTKLKYAASLVAVFGMLVLGGAFAQQALFGQPPAGGDPEKPLVQKAIRQPGDKDPAAPIVVTVIEPVLNAARGNDAMARVIAADKVDLFAAVPGRLQSVKVDIGDRVRKGDILAEVDAPLLKLDEQLQHGAAEQAKSLVLEAEASVRTALAEVEMAKNRIPVAKADAKGAKFATDEAKARYEREVAAGNTSSAADRSLALATFNKANSDLQAKEAEVAIVAANVTVKEGKLAQAEAALRTARSKVESAQLALERARVMVNMTRIASPIDGVVTKRNAFPGELVRTAESGGQEPILTVQRVDVVRVIVDVPEAEALKTKVGDVVDLYFPALGDKPIKEKIARSGFALDPKTGTMRVEIDVANPDLKLRPGMPGRTEQWLYPIFQLPEKAVGKDAEGHFVYVVRGGKAQLQRIDGQPDPKGFVHVISGLRRDDLVVADPSKLKGTGIPVEVKPASK